MIIIDDKSKNENLNKIKEIINTSSLEIDIITLNHEKYRNVIKQQKNE